MKKHSIIINDLSFSAAHFLCCEITEQSSSFFSFENLHGHNFAVNLKINGEIKADGLVVDFISIKQIANNILNQLNHKLIVPKLNSRLEITKSKDLVEISADTTFLRLPAVSVFLLPHTNSSAEFIAEYICTSLISAIKQNPNNANQKLTTIEVTVTEEPGCAAICEMDF